MTNVRHGNLNPAGSDRCTFCFDYDPATLTPKGRKCGRPAVEEIHWKDGRVSLACIDHGVAALTLDALREMSHTVRIIATPLDATSPEVKP